jgi:hypothetical protein
VALRELFARFGVQFDTGALNKGNSAVSNMTGNLRNLGAALAGIAVVGGIRSLVEDVRQMGDELDKTSIQLGISTRELQEWRFAAGLAGVDGAAFAQSLALLQRNASEAAEGTGEQADAFRKLGINVRDADGNLKEGSALLEETGLAIGALENPTERVALSLELMGRSGRRLLPLFTDGAEGLAAARAELAELGGGLSQDAIDQTVMLTDEQLRFETAVTSLKGRLALALLPTLNRVTQFFTRLSAGFADLTEGTHFAEIAMSALGAAALILAVKMLAGFAIPIAIFLTLAFIIGFVIIVVDDLITLFEGGRSVIGEFLDAMFGVGTAEQLVRDLTEAWEGLLLAIQDVKFALGFADEPAAPLGGRATTDPAEIARRQRRAAALGGGIARTGGQGPQEMAELIEEANNFRMSAGLETVLTMDEEGGLGERALTRTERREQRALVRGEEGGTRQGEVRPRRREVQAQTVEQGDINISVIGETQDPRQLTEQIRRVVRTEQGSNLRSTLEALVQEAEEDG